MLHRIRRSYGERFPDEGWRIDGGPVEMDETFVGRNPKTCTRAAALKLQKAHHAADQKSIRQWLMGMLDRETRQVRANVIPEREARNSPERDPE